MSKLLGPDGQPIPETMCVKYEGKQYPCRVVGQEVLNKSPQIALLGVLTQMGDTENLAWLAMLALAKDIYSRQPDGSRIFQDVVHQLGIVLLDRDRNETVLADELSKI